MLVAASAHYISHWSVPLMLLDPQLLHAAALSTLSQLLVDVTGSMILVAASFSAVFQ